MRLARAQADDLSADPHLVALASAAQLDLLQLDYQTAPREFSARFFEQFRQLHKYFFLEPSLRLITNAGGGTVAPCVEELGKYLREHGDEGMLITAVRGDNLLSRLPELIADGIDLMDESTGQSLAERQHQLLSAHVELGAGPFATAWEEGSRIIVAGSYDPTAPFIAAAKSEFATAWDDYDALATAALATHLAMTISCVPELHDSKSLVLDIPVPEHPEAVRLVRQLKSWADSSQALPHADVVCNVSALSPSAAGPFVGVNGARGSRPSQDWRVRLTYAAGNVVDSFRPPIVRWSRIPRDIVRVSVDTRPAVEWL